MESKWNPKSTKIEIAFVEPNLKVSVKKKVVPIRVSIYRRPLLWIRMISDDLDVPWTSFNPKIYFLIIWYK